MSSSATDLPTASVIIRTRNEARHLPRLLAALHDQNHRARDVIVVDSGSTDDTLAIARAGADIVVEISPDEFTFGQALNRGAEVARGEILALVSAHTYPRSNNWLRNLVEPFIDPTVAMVYGRQLPHLATKPGEAREFYEQYPDSSKALLDEPLGNNANSAVRASLWAEHPFDEQLSGLEDIEWARHAQSRGDTVRYAATAAIVHIHEESAPQVYRRFFREGVAFAELFPAETHYAAVAPVLGKHRRAAAATKGVADLLRDIRFAHATDASMRGMLSLPAYRACSAVGFYRGQVARERTRASVGRSAIARSPAVDEAVVIDGPASHELRARDNAAPLPGELSIRVACVGVCATDVAIADGRQHYYESGQTTYPVVPGHEYSGVVEASGSPADQGLVGARVVGECLLGCNACAACLAGAPSRCAVRAEVGVLRVDGAYATRLTVPSRSVHRLPDRMPLLFGAFVEPIAVVLKALRKVPPVRRRSVAVVGAGPIGHIAAQVLRELGASVLVIESDESRLDLLRQMDFSTATDLEDARLEGVCTVIEATGSQQVIRSLAGVSESGSRVILLGGGGSEDGELVGTETTNGHSPVYSLGSDPQDWPAAIRMLARCKLDLRALTACVTPMGEYETAWEAVRSRDRLKTVLAVDGVLASE